MSAAAKMRWGWRRGAGAVGAAVLCLALPPRAASAAPAVDGKGRQALRDLFEGRGWKQDFAHGGGYLSNYPSDDEYMNLSYVPPNPIPLNPEAHARDLHIRDELAKGRSIFAPYSECHPPGMPYIFTMDGYGGWRVSVSDHELIVFYPNNYFREIFIDGRGHVDPRKVKPTYLGDSIGWWEGSSFVVDTINVRGTNIQYEPYVPEREGTHVVERYTRADDGTIRLRITLTNPDFTRPWVVDEVLTGDPADQMRQGLCTDENHYRMSPGEGLVLRRADGKPLDKAED